MTNSLYENIQVLGNRMASNLSAMGVSASFSDGGLTLADKILEINRFTDGLLLSVDKDIAQSSNTMNFTAVYLQNGNVVSGKEVIFSSIPVRKDTFQGDSFTVFTVSSAGEITYTDDLVYLKQGNVQKSVGSGSAKSISVKVANSQLIITIGETVYDYTQYFDLSNSFEIWVSDDSTNVASTFGVYAEDTTDTNGVATAQYTCTGAGKFDVQAISGSVVSKPHIVYDTLWYDVASSSTHRSDYTNTGLTMDYVDDYTTLVNSSSTEYRIQANVTNLSSITECNLEFDLYVPSSSSANPQLYFKGATPYFGSTIFGRDAWHDVRFEFKNGAYKCFVDGVEKTEVTGSYTTGNAYFQFRLANAKMNFRKLMIYTI